MVKGNGQVEVKDFGEVLLVEVVHEACEGKVQHLSPALCSGQLRGLEVKRGPCNIWPADRAQQGLGAYPSAHVGCPSEWEDVFWIRLQHARQSHLHHTPAQRFLVGPS